ncbi:MAG: CBS domain-containing protein [Burkholderiales bacterium]
MVEHKIGSVLVLDGEKLSGLITLREVLRGINKLGNRFLSASVAEVMNAKPLSVSPEDSVDDLRSLRRKTISVTHPWWRKASWSEYCHSTTWQKKR